ncbi:CAP domain-containing protein [Litoreibacter janthinus]|uniref:Cysteine-rich secretory protein family protein n=1 Tax=Litoreibacter janthinus TaxID=670154 RepID=A0A1I6GM01_9RHOB|nr:CAP domain-containing protein [Litoreibacter janthinus]SFR43159.1 Cysteine-rich secretory protein family protein [Litoreibacter janthinus]
MKNVYVIGALVMMALTGCTPDEAPSAPPPATPVSSDATAATRADIGTLLNAARAQNGLPPLTANAQLAAAARAHAQDMARSGFFSHTGSDGSKPSKRVGAQGYNFCYVAENIAQGWSSPDQVMQGWMDSPGHRTNNLSREAREYGAARADGDYWVLVFGRSGCGAGRIAVTQRKPD